MTDTAFAYPITASGYIDTPGRAGNFIHVDRPALTGTIDTIEWIVRFRTDTFSAQTLLGWGSSAANLTLGTDLKVTMSVPGSAGAIGNVASDVFPNLFPNLDAWVKAKLTIATAVIEYSYSYDAVTPVWKPLGTKTGTVIPGNTVTLVSSTPFNIGASASGGPTPLDGRVYFVQENVNNVTTLRLDGNTDLNGIPFDATTFPVTNSGPPTSVGPPAVYAQAIVVRDASTPKLILVQPTADRPWWPHSTDPDPERWYKYPAFTVQRVLGGTDRVLGGDTTRGSTNITTEKTALRFPSQVAAPEVVQGKGILYTRVYNYSTVEIDWGLPDKFTDKWYAAAIVRSAFGYPMTVTDGQVVFQSTRSEMFPNGSPTDDAGNTTAIMFPKVYDMVRPPQGSHQGLPGGYWYYYSLFFQAGRRWYRSMVASSLVPRNYGHSEHLFDAVPPYYKWVDDQQRDEGGDLRRFLSVFGFDLDTTREFVESWQKLYWVDFSPMRLLRRLGPNFGLPYEAGIGDVRYRALLADIGYLYSIRGTSDCLEKVVTAVSKCECDVTGSANMLLLPDDSDFFEGIGHWAGIHPDTRLSVGRLEPTAGTVSTPDTASDPPTGDFVVKAKIKILDGTEPFKVIATQSTTPTTGLAWAIGMSNNQISLRVSSNGTAWKSLVSFGPLTPSQMYSGNTVTVACACDVDNGASGHTITTYLLNGTTWLYLGSLTVPGTLSMFNSTAPITVGRQPGGTVYDSRIYWAELRSGLNPDAGTLVWRFDPDDYNTGSGGTQDPRGRAWTQSTSEAIVQSITVLAPDHVALKANSIQQVPPPVANSRTYGRGTASVWSSTADATVDMVLTVGDGIAYPVKTDNTVDVTLPRYVMPRETAIHVYPQGIYGFSVWLQPTVLPIQIDTWLLWFSAEGQPDDLISIKKDGLVAAPDTNWKEWTVQGEAPAGAMFCVPAVRLHSRPAGGVSISAKVNLAAASFYLLGSAATVTRNAPDHYLNLGQELIGAPTATPPTPPGPGPFEGFVMGTPEED